MQVNIRFIFKIILVCLYAGIFYPLTAKTLYWGPVQGHSTPHSLQMVFLSRHISAATITLQSIDSKQTFTKNIRAEFPVHYKNYGLCKVQFDKLPASTQFKCSIEDAEGKHDLDQVFSTPSESLKDSFAFLLGSCAVKVPDYWKFIDPGIEDHIFDNMKPMNGDFMLWLGDFLYYNWFQYYKTLNLFKRNIAVRKGQFRREAFMKSRPQYAIWDDHDFGGDNYGDEWVLKDSSYTIFKSFWANPSYGIDSCKGIFTKFSWQDAEFFLTDNRFHRDKPHETNAEMLGKEQMKWLKENLKNSKATFKFIAMGSQALNDLAKGECWHEYEKERNELLDFITDEHISGVIFLSGDRHFAELIKLERPGSYPLYDFTSSALTSIAGSIKGSPEENNPNRIPGTYVKVHNFGRISISGPQGKRVCAMECRSNIGTQIWRYEIPEEALR